MTVLDIIEEGADNLAYSRKAVEVWPDTALDLNGDPGWVNEGIGELTDQMLSIVSRLLEVCSTVGLVMVLVGVIDMH